MGILPYLKQWCLSVWTLTFEALNFFRKNVYNQELFPQFSKHFKEIFQCWDDGWSNKT